MNSLRSRHVEAQNVTVRLAEHRALAILEQQQNVQQAKEVQEGTRAFLEPSNTLYREIIDSKGNVHVVPKTSRYSDEAIEARKNIIADHKSENSKFWNPLEHTQGGDLVIKPEINLPSVAMGQVIEVDFVPSQQAISVHTPSQSAVA